MVWLDNISFLCILLDSFKKWYLEWIVFTSQFYLQIALGFFDWLLYTERKYYEKYKCTNVREKNGVFLFGPGTARPVPRQKAACAGMGRFRPPSYLKDWKEDYVSKAKTVLAKTQVLIDNFKFFAASSCVVGAWKTIMENNVNDVNRNDIYIYIYNIYHL